MGGLHWERTESATGSGRYQRQEEFQRGTMGVIYKAFDAHMGREVALKFLLDEHKSNQELRGRFLQEARIMARLQHPGVVPIYDLHRTREDSLFFSMMFVRGVTLKDMLKKRPLLATDRSRILGIFERICQTVAFAHSHDVIHRDLKPANFMVGEFGVVRVMDWGLAKVLGETGAAASRPVRSVGMPAPMTRGSRWFSGWRVWRARTFVGPVEAGAAMGTLAYMAPEQARGEGGRIDKRSDVFGLGSVLCEILTGRPPYIGSSANTLFHQATAAELTEAESRLDNCLAEPTLVSLAKQCLRSDPLERPPDAGQVAAMVTKQLESDLRRTAVDMVRFFELSHDLFCLASLDGYFLRVNDNFPRVLGYSKDDLLSRPFLEFVHPEDIEPTILEMEKLAGGRPVVCFRNRYRDASGSYHWLEWTAKSIPDENVIFSVARTEAERLAPAHGSRSIDG